MSEYRHQAHLDAPLEAVWGLVATPSRYPEWWPRVIEVRGERFEEGDEWAQVTSSPGGKTESAFLLEKRDDMREVRMRCMLTGAYADWVLTPAQGGTFVELQMGMQPTRRRYRLLDAVIGKSYFRRWTTESLAALAKAAGRRRTPA
jgi:Polyketide cyclase / dehydrase and lipid transport